MKPPDSLSLLFSSWECPRTCPLRFDALLVVQMQQICQCLQNHLGQEQEQNEGDPCVTNCSRSVIAWVALHEQSGRLAQAIDAKP